MIESPFSSSRLACALFSAASVLLRILIEFVFAALSAEVIRLPLELRSTGGTSLINFHVAYGIPLNISHNICPSLHVVVLYSSCTVFQRCCERVSVLCDTFNANRHLVWLVEGGLKSKERSD